MAIIFTIKCRIDYPFGDEQADEKQQLVKEMVVDAAKELFASTEMLSNKYRPELTVMQEDTLSGARATEIDIDE